MAGHKSNESSFQDHRGKFKKIGHIKKSHFFRAKQVNLSLLYKETFYIAPFNHAE
jgi:hypothetical protein